MIDVRFTNRPDEWVRYVCRKEIVDRQRWGHVLEVREVEDEEETPEPAHDNSAALLAVVTAKNESGEDETVLTLERMEQKQPKRRYRKTSSDESPGDEQS